MTLQIGVVGKILLMEVDTGASCSLISKKTFKQHWVNHKLQETTLNLQTYSGEKLHVMGKLTVQVIYKTQEAELPLVIVKGAGPSLLSRDWMAHLKLDWKSIHHIDSPLNSVLHRYKTLLQGGLGTFKDYEAKIHVDPQATPKYWKAHPVPYAKRAKVEQELQRLVQEGIFEPVQYADWAAPIVPVLKSNGTVRICGDFKVTVNQVSRLDHYPIPHVEDLLSKLSGGQYFTKLDMSQAYQQLKLDCSC